jgi:hypothetical protein
VGKSESAAEGEEEGSLGTSEGGGNQC